MPYHVPVMLDETIDALQLRPEGVYVDATMGGGGHTRAILERLGHKGHLWAFDQDADAVQNAPHDARVTFIWGNFRYITNFLHFYGVQTVDGILADLGVSSHHFDTQDRGFSFRFAGPLDMRMNRQAAHTAADIVNGGSESELTHIFYDYGELPQARRMARVLVAARAESAIDTVERLTQLLRPLCAYNDEKKQLAQAFQALRIAVNSELDALQAFLVQTPALLKPQGRLVVLTYHSLEDRLVKNFMRSGHCSGYEEKDMIYGHVAMPLRPLNRKVICPSESEVARNPRARSAKLRAAVKK